MTEQEKERIIANLKARFGIVSANTTGVILCRECRNPMELTDDLDCGCVARLQASVEDIEFQAENKRQLKVVGIVLMVFAVIIALVSYFTADKF